MNFFKPFDFVAVALCLLLCSVRAQTLTEQNQDISGVISLTRRRLLKAAFQQPGRLMRPLFSPDGKQLFFGTTNPNVPDYYLMRSVASTQIKARRLQSSKYVEGRKPIFTVGTGRAFSPDGSIFAVGNSGAGQDPTDNSISLWNTRTWRKIGVLKGHPHTVSSLSFSPDGRRILSGNDAGGVIIHDIAKRMIVLSWSRGSFEKVRFPASVTFCKRDGKTTPIAIVRSFPEEFLNRFSREIAGSAPSGGGALGDFEIWDIAANREIKDLKLPRPYNQSNISNTDIAFSPDGKLLAFFTISPREGSNSGKPYYITVVNWETEQQIESKIDAPLYESFTRYNTLQFLPDHSSVLFSDWANDRLLIIDISVLQTAKQP